MILLLNEYPSHITFHITFPSFFFHFPFSPFSILPSSSSIQISGLFIPFHFHIFSFLPFLPFLPFLSFHQIHFHSIHIMPFFLLLLLLLLCVCPVVECDDTEGLRSAVGCLCSVNSGGVFGSCCSSHSNGASLTLSDPQCFISNLGLDSTNQYVLGLFVIHHFLQSSSSPFHSIQFALTTKD